jgi:Na+-driven multidrug efflux pump
VVNSVLGTGILPSGGDTKFVLAAHLTASYLFGIPAAVAFGIFAGLNARAVFGARALEEVIKATAFLLRFGTPAWYRKSGKSGNGPSRTESDAKQGVGA